MLSTLISGRRYCDKIQHVDIWKETAVMFSTLTSGYGDNVKHVDIWKEIR